MLSNISRIPKQIMKINFSNKQNQKQLVTPILFDVSLRDGLQGLSKERQESFSINDKIDIFHKIINLGTKNIEIGAIVNPKIMPAMADSLKMHKHATDFKKKVESMIGNNKTFELNNYIVVPNEKGFNIGMQHGVKNFSFLTSVSNSFQKKNVNKSLKETRVELNKMVGLLDDISDGFKTKLYISCINECPVEGKIDKDFIVHEILNYYKDLPVIDEFCLSDTCGSLNFIDYKYIVDNCMHFGIPSSKISLHLHVKNENIKELEKIMFYSLDNNIIRFDVSILESGGCSATIHSSKLLPNMSYELFYSFLKKYYE